MSNITVHQSDERMYFLERMLKGMTAPVPVHVFAPNVMLNAKIVGGLEEGAVCIGGRADEEAAALFNSLDIRYFNMMENEDFQAENARLTAEGALAAIIDRSLISLNDMRVLVIGFGRTGAAVVRLLDKLGVRLDVATTASHRPARAFAEKTVAASRFDLSGYDVIVNTVPEKIVSEKELLSAKQGAVYVELASKPGINLEYAKYIGIDADVYPALPAKASPVSAAKIIKKFVTEVLL